MSPPLPFVAVIDPDFRNEEHGVHGTRRAIYKGRDVAAGDSAIDGDRVCLRRRLADSETDPAAWISRNLDVIAGDESNIRGRVHGSLDVDERAQ